MPNVYSTTDPSQPGYFRIGYVVLQIPPTDISCNKVVNDDQVSTLRGQSPMFVKSGQSRWDVTVRWKALRFLSANGSFDWTQWTDLQEISAMFKVTPFVEVDNEFLRQHFTDVQGGNKSSRMAFALKQLRIDTNPDSVNVLDITLTMSLFNYGPYTKDFAYVSTTTSANSGADQSDVFKNFIATWIAANFDTKPANLSSPPIKNWLSQSEGAVKFKWRQYSYVPFQSPAPPALMSGSPPGYSSSAGYNPSVPQPQIPAGATNVSLPSSVQQLINSIAPAYGLDPTIISAQCQAESSGKVDAVSSTGAIGLMQVLQSTAGASVNLYDPTQNITAGCKYMQTLLKKPYINGSYFLALGAYNAGPGYVYAYSKGVSVTTKSGLVINPQAVKTQNGLPPAGIPHYINATSYATGILNNAGKSSAIPPTVLPPVDNKIPSPPTSTQPLDTPDAGIISATQAAIAAMNKQPGNWILDYTTEFGALFYQEKEIDLASADSSSPSDYTMFTNQISIVMVNNLPVIPLAALQYPTFQHVGPCDTMVSISFNSVGDTETNLNEPEHLGVEALAAMATQLEDQFHALRNVSRAVSSIHRLQAVFIENQVLNLLGIQGATIRQLNTETVPEAVGLAQVALIVSQYDNVFEEITPYSINGVASAYSQTMKNVLTSNQLSALTAAEKNAYTLVQAFSTAWKSLDPNYLINQILTLSKSNCDYLSDVTNTPSISINGQQQSDLLNALDLMTPGVMSSIVGALGGANNQSSTYPGLQARRLTLQKSSAPMSYADFFVFSQLPVLVNQTEVSALKQQLSSQFSAQMPTILDNMYSVLWNDVLLTNPAMGREASLITNSPTFQSQFAGAISVEGPSANPINNGHFCYKDLGLTNYNQTPTSYMVNYNAQISSDTANIITTTLGTATQAANDVNASPGTQGQASGSTQSGYTFTGDLQGLQAIGAGSAVSRMFNLPGYSMDSAYPTFKLFLMEENNTGPFFAFDNFYSYATVLDIEVIKYQDQPDTAIIQITNLANLLMHRLYDDTAAGKMEAKADQFNVSSALTSTGQPTTGGNPNSGIQAGKTIFGQPYSRAPRKNMPEGLGETYSRVPLKYFALQTGSKIQVRLGFSNNPDALYPVFTGQVTEIEGNEILTITCQSFQLELMQLPGTAVIANSLLGFNFLSGGAAFGGYQVMNSGDTVNVMKTMLGSPTARHFGRWQVGTVNDKLLKGFTWTDLAGKTLQSVSNKTLSSVGSLLQTGYDRSGENILVNFTINYDASNPATSSPYTRSWYSENPNWFLGSAKYSIPKQSKFSVWEILKDVSRRYPEYNLMVRDYGFPYQADATLVYAHPLDWYYSRPLLYGEAEKEKPNNTTQGALFSQWWSSKGKAAWTDIFDQALKLDPSVAGVENLISQSSLKAAFLAFEDPVTNQAGSGPEGFYTATSTMHSLLTGNTTDLGTLGSLASIAIQIQSFGNVGGGFAGILDNDFQALYREWLVYLQNAEPAANSSRIKPVRTYHLIDHNHIVHNGISINNKCYNAVKIGDFAPYKFNQNIPDQHTRVLDVTDLINDPDQNVYPDVTISSTFSFGSHPIALRYAQSFLREEVGKAYRGELILRGVPEIEPFDVILMNDPSTGMVGPIEVESVIHSFNMENGYITIVKPRMLLIVNESVSMSLIQSISAAWANASANLADLGQLFTPGSSLSVVGGQNSIVAGLGATSLFTNNIGGYAWAPPLAIIAASLGLLAKTGILVYTATHDLLNFFKIQPLSRFGRPWIGGLEGFQLSDFGYSLGLQFKWFDALEIQPLIESWETFMNYQNDYQNNASPGTGY